VLPREHGSWSLALEPVALGLLLAPSLAGGYLAAATFAGFLTRRPLKLALSEPLPARRVAARQALVILSVASVALAALAFATAQNNFAVWLLPAIGFGAVFLWFDLRKAGREQVAEICGSAAFAALTGAIVAAAGYSPQAILVANFLMLARAVPTVLFVRAIIRGNKTGAVRPFAALSAALGVTLLAALLVVQNVIPAITAIPIVLLLARAIIFLSWRPTAFRARAIGIQELVIGVLYLGGIALSWRP
jgi:hypothetical protein